MNNINKILSSECLHLYLIFAFFRQGSACSHIAALLFKLEACVRNDLNKMAVTSMLCQWNRSRKSAEPALLQVIDFKKPKKDQLPHPNKTVENPVYCYSVCAENSTKSITPEKIAELKNIMPKAVYFTSTNETYNQEDVSDDTTSADECDENVFPEPFTSLFDYTAINLDDKSLQQLCTQEYETYKSSYTAQSYVHLAEITKTQSLSNTWKLHRAGRITASNFHEVMHFQYRSNASSLLYKLMQYSAQPNTPSLKYGREMEEKARQFYASLMQSYHENFTVEITGLHIDVEKPFLGASPDGMYLHLPWARTC